MSFKIDWLDLLAVQGTHSQATSPAPQLENINSWFSAFFMVQQFSHPYMTAGKNHSFDYIDLCQQSDVFASFSLVQFSSVAQ